MTDPIDRSHRRPVRSFAAVCLAAIVAVSLAVGPGAVATGTAQSWRVTVDEAAGTWALARGDRTLLDAATARYFDGDRAVPLGRVKVTESTAEGALGTERRWRLDGERMTLQIAIPEDFPVVVVTAAVARAERLRRVETLVTASAHGGFTGDAITAEGTRFLSVGFEPSDPPRTAPVRDVASSTWWMTAVTHPAKRRALVVGHVPGARAGFDTLTVKRRQQRLVVDTATWLGDIAVKTPRAFPSVVIVPGRRVTDALRRFAECSAKLASIDLPARAPTAWGPHAAIGPRYTLADIDARANVAKRDLASFGVGVVRLDDGYQPTHHAKRGGGLGDWLRADDRFTSGMPGLVDAIRERGLDAGTWLAPFLVGKSAEPFREAGGFLYAGDDGRPKALDRGPLATGWRGDPVYSIDAGHDEAQSWLHHVGRTIAKLGIRHVRAAFLRDGMRPGRRANGMSAAAAFRKGLEAFRAGLGSRTFLVAEDAPLAPVGGIADAVRLAPGTAVRGWPEVRRAVRSIAYRYFLHGAWWYGDAGDAVLAGLTDDEARAYLSFLALTVGVSSLGDDLERLPTERRDLLKRVLPMVPGRTRPLDLFTTKGLPSVWDMRVHRAGERWNVAGFFNWTDRPQIHRVAISDLQGLDAVNAALVYDFWSDEFIGVREGTIEVLVPPHACRVYQIRRHTSAPQLLSVTRHVTGGGAALRGVSLRRTADRRDLVVKTDLIPLEPIGIRVYSPWREVVRSTVEQPWTVAALDAHPDGVVIRADATPFGHTYAEVPFAMPAAPLPRQDPPSIRSAATATSGDLRVVVLPPEMIRTGGAGAWIRDATGEPGALVGTWGRAVEPATGLDVDVPQDVVASGHVWLTHPSLGRDRFAIGAARSDGRRLARAIYVPGEPATIVAVGDPRTDPARWLRAFQGRLGVLERGARAWVEGAVARQDRSGLIDRVEALGPAPLDVGDRASETASHYEVTERAEIVRTTIGSGASALTDFGRRITDTESFALPVDPAQRGWTLLRRTTPEDRGKRLLVLVGGAGDAREWRLEAAPTGDWPIDRFDIPPVAANRAEPIRVTIMPVDGGAYVSLRYRAYLKSSPRSLSLGDAEPVQSLQRTGRTQSHRAVHGGPLVIGDRLFLEGLGTSAPARLTYSIPAGIERFEAKVGIDASVGQRGGVVFVVELDGREVYRSPKCYGGQAARDVRIETGNATTLCLIVDPAGAAQHDRANWGDAAFIRRAPAR